MTTKINRFDDIEVDDRSPMDALPYWARSTNPIVRRHLGLYWRTLPPEFEPIFYITGGWIVALLVGIILPFITDLATMLIVVSVMVIPLTMIFYLHALFSIAANSAAAMSDEMRNKTMHLLMATPMSLDQILLGKVAASIWRKMDDLILIVQGAAFFGPPLIIMHYAGLFPLFESGIVGYPLIIGMTLVALGRLILEPVMFGMIGVGIGAFVPYRSTAMSVSVALVAFYFLLMYMLNQLGSQSVVAALEAVEQATELTLSVANLRLAGALALMIGTDFVLPLLLPYGLIRLMIRIVGQQVQSS
jgi:ABC-type transport system involved in multi-copper enzyme maturation permease subunit